MEKAQARRALARAILTKIDAAKDEEAKLDVLEGSIESITRQVTQLVMVGALGGLISQGFEAGAMIECKKCKKSIREVYAKQRLGFCKACFDTVGDNLEVH